ncbi:MAG: helix-turn-helix domain-containing protein, partial [bacterium]|nr:helix-turn-helix domain-containing protein [bacterium]
MKVTRWQQLKAAPFRQAYFFPKAISVNWYKVREEGKRRLSPKAQLKLEWIIFYHTQAGKNAKATATHFGITRKTFHKWLKRYN